MRAAAILVLFLSRLSFTQAASSTKSASPALITEVRASSVHVRMSEDIVVSVYFRSPHKTTTIWNALWWGGSTGLELGVFDSFGHQFQPAMPPIEPMPPHLTGKGSFLSIGGRTFARFDSRFAVSYLFPQPGSYTIKCTYRPPLGRNYFKGHAIWGREDGVIESAPLSISVEK